MVIPSIRTKGSPSMIMRSAKVPESPSSALQTRYLRAPAASARGLPLDPGGKARSAPAPEARLGHLLDDAGGPERQGALQAAVAAVGLVVVQRLRIGDPAAGERQARLALEERQLLGPADPLGMGTALEQARGDQRRDLVGVDGPIADAALGGLDLDQGLQLEHAARAVADQMDVAAGLGGLDGEGAGHLVGADGERRRVAGNVKLQRHARASVMRASSRASSMRPTSLSSSMAEGPEAQRPRQ